MTMPGGICQIERCLFVNSGELRCGDLFEQDKVTILFIMPPCANDESESSQDHLRNIFLRTYVDYA